MDVDYIDDDDTDYDDAEDDDDDYVYDDDYDDDDDKIYYDAYILFYIREQMLDDLHIYLLIQNKREKSLFFSE